MVYLDYSATTPVNKDVLKSFNDTCINYVGNTNSLHKLGIESKNLMSMATNQIANLLQVKPSEIIYTSGSSEANNFIIKSVCLTYPNRGKHIITTKLEHASIIEPLKFLEKQGYIIDYVNLDNNGCVDLDHLRKLISDDTILVTIASVSSELGILQPISEIGKIIRKYPKCIFHSDMTQSIGKVNVSLENVDAASFSSHKFYGLKGIGILVKKENINLIPLIHGGESTTVFRSGTPALPLIVSISKALRLALENIDKDYQKVQELSDYLKKELSNIDGVIINNTSKSIPHIVNISILKIKPETLIHALEMKDIYISTKSACSSQKAVSDALFSLYNDYDRATHSIRISISKLTTKEEITVFIKALKECIKSLTI